MDINETLETLALTLMALMIFAAAILYASSPRLIDNSISTNVVNENYCSTKEIINNLLTLNTKLEATQKGITAKELINSGALVTSTQCKEVKIRT